MTTKEEVMKEVAQLRDDVEMMRTRNGDLYKAKQAAEAKYAELLKEMEDYAHLRAVLLKILGGAIPANVADVDATFTMDKIKGTSRLREQKVEFDTKNGPKDQILCVMATIFKGKRKRIDSIRRELTERKFKDAADNLSGYLQELIQTGDVIEESEDKTHKGYRLPSEVTFEEAK